MVLVALTQTRGEELCVEVCQEFLAFCVELAHSRNHVAGQADADDLQDSLEDEQGEVGEVRVG